MNRITSTINPLHFEDLEPHRFEDLIRQLSYDFKVWNKIEATGRSGSDEGFDIRAFEKIIIDSDNGEADLEEDDSILQTSDDRLWLIQCKREKVITPTKIKKYAEDIVKNNKGLYGVIFACACDLSKSSRDIFYKILRDNSVQEFYIWGRAEIEDMLFQPKNDNLLFAYFGISLVMRRKSLTSELRTKLVKKRKALKLEEYREVLIRDINDKKYPFNESIKDFNKKPKWVEYRFVGHYFGGIEILIGQNYAYLDDDKKHYDFIEEMNDANITYSRWFIKNEKREKWEKISSDAYDFWQKIPEKNRAWLKTKSYIPYEEILEIDKDGDELSQAAHIYIDFEKYDIFRHYYQIIETYNSFNRQTISPQKENRIQYFPKKFPKYKPPSFQDLKEQSNKQ